MENEKSLIGGLNQRVDWLVLMAVILGGVTVLFLGDGALAESGNWAGSLKEKGQEFYDGLVKLGSIAVSIGLIIWALWGAVTGNMPWQRIGVIIICAVLIGAAGQVVEAFVGE